MTGQRFGGGWTQIKLDVLRSYLQAYTTALKNQPFKLLYVDAFAGTGEVVPKVEPASALDGSAKIALDTEGFDRYLFIEQHAGRFRELEALCGQYPNREIWLRRGDANHLLRELLEGFDSRNWRTVVFLDPFGLSVDWDTLAHVAATKAADVWYLFALSGLYRQAARDHSAVDPGKAAAISRALGTEAWRETFYRESPQAELFRPPGVHREADVDAIEAFVKERLDSIFPKVLPPLRLPKSGAPLFSLFFAMANANPTAIKVATRIAGHLLSQA
jgi:three-Cys-motif partner protein